MKIIIRACGERTERKCIELAKLQGDVHVIKAVPFGEAMRQAYKLGMTWSQKWIPMVDADVLLSPGTLKNGINMLNGQRNQIFCFDGHTKDKILLKKRRAGIHIYKRVLLKQALPLINDNNLKPESFVRRAMSELGYPTFSNNRLIFGRHDYEQFYRDLWRKGVAQSQKLARMIRAGNMPRKWRNLSLRDKDYKVILEANRYGVKNQCKICIDSRIDYDARLNIKKIGLREKGVLR